MFLTHEICYGRNVNMVQELKLDLIFFGSFNYHMVLLCIYMEGGEERRGERIVRERERVFFGKHSDSLECIRKNT